MIKINNLNFFEKIQVLIASGFGIGFMPKAPGTFGTALAIPIYLWIPDKFALIIVTLVLLAIGIMFASNLEKKFKKDPQWIIIDEIVGFLIPLISIYDDWILVLVAFVLFRFFDIVKPLGIDKLQNLKGGFGVMVDDVLAGIYTWIIMILITQTI